MHQHFEEARKNFGRGQPFEAVMLRPMLLELHAVMMLAEPEKLFEKTMEFFTGGVQPPRKSDKHKESEEHYYRDFHQKHQERLQHLTTMNAGLDDTQNWDTVWRARLQSLLSAEEREKFDLDMPKQATKELSERDWEPLKTRIWLTKLQPESVKVLGLPPVVLLKSGSRERPDFFKVRVLGLKEETLPISYSVVVTQQETHRFVEELSDDERDIENVEPPHPNVHGHVVDEVDVKDVEPPALAVDLPVEQLLERAVSAPATVRLVRSRSSSSSSSSAGAEESSGTTMIRMRSLPPFPFVVRPRLRGRPLHTIESGTQLFSMGLTSPLVEALVSGSPSGTPPLPE